MPRSSGALRTRKSGFVPPLESGDVEPVLLTCAVLTWTIVDGPVFMTERSDNTAKLLVALIVAFTVIHLAIRAYRRVRPMPDRRLQVQR